MFFKKLHFQLRLDLLKGQKQGWDEKTQNTTLLLNDGTLLSGIQSNALAPLVLFVVLTYM